MHQCLHLFICGTAHKKNMARHCLFLFHYHDMREGGEIEKLHSMPAELLAGGKLTNVIYRKAYH